MFLCKTDGNFLIRSYSTLSVHKPLKIICCSPFLNSAADANGASLMLPNQVNSANVHRKYFCIFNYVTKVTLIAFSSSLAPYFDLFHFIWMHQDLYHYKETLSATRLTRQIAH